MSHAYRALADTAVVVAPFIWRDERQRTAHAHRLAAPAEMARWAASHRDTTRPLVWFHAPSVGEGLQARIVLEEFRRIVPAAQLVYTHFSPSALEFAQTVPADWRGYLPYDRAADVAAALAALRPDLLVLSKLDVWPELTVAAHDFGAKTALIAATVLPTSGRLRWPSRRITMPAYRALDFTATISADDATRLEYLGVLPERIVILGDPRIDSAIAVVAALASSPPLLAVEPHRTLIAGSTWPDDERVIFPAFADVTREYPDTTLVIAPHHPSPERLAGIDDAARECGLARPVRLSDDPLPHVRCIVVDRLGVLARLYREGFAGYVGGGFGGDGVHSVIEPAAAERAVIVGPNDRGNREVALLRQAGGLVQLPTRDPVRLLARTWKRWLNDPADATRSGAMARTALAPEEGAARKTAERLAALLRGERIAATGGAA